MHPPPPRNRRASKALFAASLIPWIALLAWLSSVAWFLCDDAFISFRYARNLLEGHGLVFNAGERVEGYSNLLWVLQLAGIWRTTGLAPEDTAAWLSVAWTVGTLAVLLWWALRLPGAPKRPLVAWMATGLVCSLATFAVWTSAGGLETRSLTFFVLLAVALLTVYRTRRTALAGASAALALAALTRPEGPLFAACCVLWHAAQRRMDTGRWLGDWRGTACLALPVLAVTAAHYLWRYGYYGEWLPNTYYAKHVRPWYEMGTAYFATASIETMLPLWIVLASAAAWVRWRRVSCTGFALPIGIVLLHASYVWRVGGDHFEYRPLDVYWPLLAVPAANALAELGRLAAKTWKYTALAATGAAFALVLASSSVLQGLLLVELSKVNEHVPSMRPTIDTTWMPTWLRAAVGGQTRGSAWNQSSEPLFPSFVALRSVEHREFAKIQRAWWEPYGKMPRGVLPADAVTWRTGLGIFSYYLPDLTVVDTYGLTDRTVARNPVTALPRRMAHDRRPPPGYLMERGVNILIDRALTGEPTGPTPTTYLEIRREPEEQGAPEPERTGPTSRTYVAKVGSGLWMPFDLVEVVQAKNGAGDLVVVLAPDLQKARTWFGTEDLWLIRGAGRGSPHEPRRPTPVRGAGEE